ncbi:hypothetical protein P8452_46381 [Trifolium repens]|nr:hypothetical protein P8452_46381 [Trifolium repens]
MSSARVSSTPTAVHGKTRKKMIIFNEETGAKVIGSGIEIPLADEEWNQWSTPWMKTLITKVMGKSVNFKTIDNNLQRKWAKKGPIKVVDMADGYFLVYFSCEEDYNHALFEGATSCSLNMRGCTKFALVVDVMVTRQNNVKK